MGDPVFFLRAWILEKRDSVLGAMIGSGSSPIVAIVITNFRLMQVNCSKGKRICKLVYSFSASLEIAEVADLRANYFAIIKIKRADAQLVTEQEIVMIEIDTSTGLCCIQCITPPQISCL